MTFLFFLVIDHIYQVLPALNVIYNVYDPFLTKESSISDAKIIVDDTFFTQFVLSQASYKTTSPNIGGRIPQIFGWGPSPQSLPKSPPMHGITKGSVPSLL